MTAWDGRIRGDARHLPIADESVQCVITSPPYWGLRDYGADSQIGLERTVEEYVEALMGVASEIRRVLKADGTFWLNLGDCYHSGDRGAYRNDAHRWEKSELQKGNRGNATTVRPNRLPQTGLKDKDLVGVPWRVAFALQADGWYLRSDIIWAKKNCMPESVTDRPTRSHEYLFLFAKAERYFYDADAIAERAEYPTGPNAPGAIKSPYGQGFTRSALQGPARRHAPPGQQVDSRRSVHMAGTSRNDGDRWRVADGGVAVRGSRNKRDVWWIATNPYSDWQETSRQVRVAKDEIDDDTRRITSPDCPVHAGLSDSVAIPFCGVREGDWSIRSAHNENDHAQEPSIDSVPTETRRASHSAAENSDLQGRLCLEIAMQHGNQSSRTDPEPSNDRSDTPYAQSLCDIERNLVSDASCDSAERTPESSISPDDSLARPSVQIVSCSEDRILAACSCEFYRIATEKTSHYATFPPSLIEPCILAGSRPGDIVLDPFFGSGTVGMVAEKFSRRWIGVDLGYHDLQAKRVKNVQKVLIPCK